MCRSRQQTARMLQCSRPRAGGVRVARRERARSGGGRPSVIKNKRPHESCTESILPLRERPLENSGGKRAHKESRIRSTMVAIRSIDAPSGTRTHLLSHRPCPQQCTNKRAQGKAAAAQKVARAMAQNNVLSAGGVRASCPMWDSNPRHSRHKHDALAN